MKILGSAATTQITSMALLIDIIFIANNNFAPIKALCNIGVLVYQGDNRISEELEMKYESL